MPLRLSSLFMMLFTSMVIAAQEPATVQDSVSARLVDLASKREGAWTEASASRVNADAMEYQNQVQMYDYPLEVEAGFGSPVTTKSSTPDSPPADDSIGAVAHELTVSAGIAVTPDRKATEGGTWNQESRNGPSISVEYRLWKGVFSELDYVNTNTRLANYTINTWTMNRLSLDAGYEHSWRMGKLSPFIKIGGGVMVLVSGLATNQTSAGLDDRAEILTGTGIRYRLSNHMSAVLEYEGRIIRNPDFADHGWRPERNFLSEGTVGVSYSFGGAGRNSR